jgi:hypothetical protein
LWLKVSGLTRVEVAPLRDCQTQAAPAVIAAGLRAKHSSLGTGGYDRFSHFRSLSKAVEHFSCSFK